ncbi:MAG: IS21 family transposase [Planctomycetes bacterium]|nr:IS21 family transposase [Planctomycetota bacterium]
MISPKLEAEILRLYHAEKWRVGTIAGQLGVHHGVVRRVLARDGAEEPKRSRATRLDPYIPLIIATWKQYPKLLASRLYEMCHQRGYRGSPDHFRHMVAPYRPKPTAEAYLRLKTLPGEQAQVDWGHFGKLTIGHAARSLLAFVMVLSYSRRIFLRFFLGQQSENFLRGHQAAFGAWGGVVRVVLYDNLKSAVLERRGDAIRFNPLLLEFARHYRFAPRPVAVARGNEKGRVERSIAYIRRAFFMARRFRDVDDLNRQAQEWCDGPACQRRWVEDDRLTVREAFEKERPLLLPLPPAPFPTDERRELEVGKTPYVRFDHNDYSVPHELVRQTVVVVASLQTVRIMHRSTVVAEHDRGFDRRRQIEDPAHIERLVEHKRQARAHRGLDRLAAAAPASRELLTCLAQRGANLGSATARLLGLLDEFGAARLEQAIGEAIEKDIPHHHAVRQILERQHRAEGRRPALPVELPDDPRVRELTIRPHTLESYDALTRDIVDPQEPNDHGE